MEKKEKNLPFEENVDIEFEYKVFLILDKLKRYKYLIIGAFVLLLIGIVGFFIYKQNQEKILNEASGLAYKIKLNYEKGEDEKALSLINEFKKKYAETPFIKLVSAYEININKRENPLKTEETSKLIREKLFTDQLKSGYKEYNAYLLYLKDEKDKALPVLGSVDEKYYNNISAKLLTAIIFKETGNTEKAKSIFEEIAQKRFLRYFSTIASENLQ